MCCGEDGWSELAAHPLFANLNWARLEAGVVDPPFVPDVRKKRKQILTTIAMQ